MIIDFAVTIISRGLGPREWISNTINSKLTPSIYNIRVNRPSLKSKFAQNLLENNFVYAVDNVLDEFCVRCSCREWINVSLVSP